MRTLITLFLLAGIALPAFPQSGVIVLNDHIKGAKYASAGSIVMGDTIPGRKYKPFTKTPADTLWKKFPKSPTTGWKKPPVDRNAQLDSIMARLNTPGRKQPLTDNMPNAIAVQPFPSANSVYKGNNGEGFDIYESGIDRMPVFMPDSTNAAILKMPKIVRKPKNK